jgi:hypothetical protein
MLIPKHCSNPKCHISYTTPNGDDIYSEVLVKLSTESDARVISICTRCREKYTKEMAEDVLRDVMPIEIKRVVDNILISSADKNAMIEKLRWYEVEAIGLNIDEINRKIL